MLFSKRIYYTARIVEVKQNWKRSLRSDETSHLKTDVSVGRANAWWDLARPLPADAAAAAGRCCCNRIDDSDDDDDDDCRFVATAVDATVIHTTLCHRPLGSDQCPAADGRTAHSRTDEREGTRAEQMKNGLVPR